MYPLFLTILLIPLFWVLIIRPQQQRQREHRELVAKLAPGDRVEAFSGIYGTITEVHDRTVRIEVAQGVVLTMARLAVSSLLEDDDLEDQVFQSETDPATSSDPTDGDEL